jgi:hypothetical protein
VAVRGERRPVHERPLAHYVITTSRDFLEILAADPPEVEWVGR